MKARHISSGFTLIELVMVIVILSVVSLYAASRYLSAGIPAAAVQDQAIAVIRQVQVNRMQSNLSDTTIVDKNDFILNVTNNCIGSKASCSSQTESRSDWFMPDGVSFSPNLELEFNLLGNPSGATPTIQITENGSGKTCSIHINSQGYVEKRTCS
ncbi:type II secretion system protein [Vibrio rotiferianus]|jgi:MSHA pilin protein MshC|uniref:MSHA biogenesis protein MshC n=1 Tax=Vibrio rotiferianus TaxID=190895 RepID=A0ABX3D6X7_9VIBR|nr:type II secretion system protein [Vibrio rotiferianus]OHY92523.1 MSHA biogenesis protein MshC [Vibrio rotiferianus]